MPIDPLTTVAFTQLGEALNKNAKDIKISTQNLKDTQWAAVSEGSQALNALSDSLNISGPAISVLTGKIVEATSQERVDAMMSLVNLMNSPAFSTAINAASTVINNLFREIQIYSAILQQLQKWEPPEWLKTLLELNSTNPYNPVTYTPSETPYGTPWVGGNIGGGHTIVDDDRRGW